MPRSIEVPILLVLIIITAYFYFKERKKSYLAAKALDEEIKTQKEEEKNSIIYLSVKIDGMMCEKCASRVTDALSKFGKATVDLKENKAVIECSELPDTKEIEQTVNELGYTFKGIE